MSWLIVRQYRTEILYGAPVFIALLALFALADFNLRNALSDAGLSSCLGQSPLTRACDQAASVVIHDHNWSSSLMPWMNFLPVLIGVIAGLIVGNDIGARLANRVDRSALHVMMVFFVSAMVLYMAWKALS